MSTHSCPRNLWAGLGRGDSWLQPWRKREVGAHKAAPGWLGAPCGCAELPRGAVLCLSWRRSVERRCLPLWLPHFFLAGAGVCWAGGGWGTPGRLPFSAWTPDPFPALATPGHTHCVLPHLGRPLAHLLDDPDHLAAPQLLQGRAPACGWAEPGLLKPCGERERAHGSLRVTASSTQLQRAGLQLARRPAPQRQGPGYGQTPPHRDRPSLGPGWPGHPLSSAPTRASSQAQGVL